jgi:segregation and condensation protein A
LPYEVKLEVFEGPLDLLLHLITRQRVDIYDVSIATITDEYLTALEQMGAMDLEVTTGFLVVAATLLELKSVRLLPVPDEDRYEGMLEERDLLLARLVECATLRAAGAELAIALAAGDLYHPHPGSPDEGVERAAGDLLEGVRVEHLADVAARLLAPAPAVELDVSHVRPIQASVRSAIAELAGRLQHGGAASFSTLCAGADTRIEVVVRFLALLELFKAGAISISQGERFGDIHSTWTGEVEVDEVVAEAEEYSVSGEEAR